MAFNKYYKEKDYVESILNQKKFNNTIKSDLKLIAKYYKSVGKTDEEIEQEIKELLKKKLVNYNEVLYFKIIDNAINYANKPNNNLIQIDSIFITKSEMDFILSLPYEHLEKKILFTFIVIDKLKRGKSYLNGLEDSNSHYFGGSGLFSYKSLLDTLQEKITRTYREKGVHKTIKKFNDDGLTRSTNLASLELIFINKIYDCNDIVLEVKNFDNIGLYFNLYIEDETIKLCENCKDNLYIVTGKNAKYCVLCRRQKELEKKRKWKQNNK